MVGAQCQKFCFGHAARRGVGGCGFLTTVCRIESNGYMQDPITEALSLSLYIYIVIYIKVEAF